MYESEERDLDQEIVKFVLEKFDEQKKKAVLLTSVGHHIRSIFTDIDELLKGGKLSDYIKFRLGNDITLIQNPSDKLVWGAIPTKIKVSSQADLAKLFEKDPTHAPFNTQISFNKNVWIAFRSQCDGLKDRSLNIQSSSEPHQDIASNEAIPKHHVRIPNKYLNAKETRTAEETKRKILEWADDHNIDLGLISQKPTPPETQSLLTALLNRLTEKEQEQISMPLSVIKKLL